MKFRKKSNKEKTKILIVGMEERNYYLLPGGRVHIGEDRISAINREIKEEIDYQNRQYYGNSKEDNYIDNNLKK